MSEDETPTQVRPLTFMQNAVVDIWSEVLQRDEIGIDDDFIKLGGDSLQATLVVGRLSRKLGISLPAATLFEARTVRELAERAERAQGRAASGVSVAAGRDPG